MASTTRIAALKDALCDALLALAVPSGLLDGVSVSSAEMPALRTHDTIELIGEDMIEQEWSALSPRLPRNEAITLTGMTYAKRPGADEETVRSARTRAVYLVQVVEDVFTGTNGDPKLGGVIKAGRCRPMELYEGWDSEGRIAIMRFEIRTELQRLVMP